MKKGALYGVIGIVIVAIVAAVFILPGAFQLPTTAEETKTTTTPTKTTPKQEEKEVILRIVGGEVDVTKYGYAFKGEELKSPGPDIRVKVGTKITVIFENIGNLPHTFAVTEEKKFDADPLWGAQIGSPTDPVGSKKSGQVTFVPKKPGEYYYVCQVPGHIELGMWGIFIVEG